MTELVWTVRDDPRGRLVICEIDGETGSARVMSAGETEARQRAEAQARAKLEQKRGSAQ